MAPTVSANAATAALWPDARANGINWLMTIVPAVVPSMYASQSFQNVGVRTMSDHCTSAPGRDAARTFDGSQPAGTYPAGGFFTSHVAMSVIAKHSSARI